MPIVKMDSIVRQGFLKLDKDAKKILAGETSRINEVRGVFGVVDSSLFQKWAISVLNLLERSFGKESVHFREFSKAHDALSYEHKSQLDRIATSRFQSYYSIFKAAQEDFVGGYLFQMKDLIKAETFDEIITQSQYFLDGGYKDAACIIAGVALESAIKELCIREGISHAKLTLEAMNIELRKKGRYNLSKQKMITAWSDLRNNAAHGKWDAYSKEDVRLLIEGVKAFIADTTL